MKKRSQQVRVIEHLVPGWGCCLGGALLEDMSLGMGFGSL